MTRKTILVSLKEKNRPNDEPCTLTAEQAAEYVGLELDYFICKSSKGRFEANNYEITRITPIIKRRGTKIVRDDGKEWSTIKECANDEGIKPDQVAVWIRAKQCFDFNGHHYTAPEYKVIKHVHTKPKRMYMLKTLNDTELQSLGSVPVESTDLTQQQILETLDYEVKEVANQLSTEEKCIQLLQQLVKERLDKTEYNKASKVLNALITLTE